MTEDEFYVRLRTQHEIRLPFVVYRKPDETGVNGLLQKNSEIHEIVDYKENGFVFAPFDDKKVAFFIPFSASEKISFEAGIKEKTPFSENKSSSEEKFLEGDKENHITLVKKAISVLKSGEVQKIVLSRKEKVTLKNVDPIGLFQDLLKAYPTALVYCWVHPETGIWLGATPEKLFDIKGHKFETMALAGTQKFEGSMKVDWGKKEKKEQQFVTDFVLENLAPVPPKGDKMNNLVSVATGKLEKSNTYTSKAGNLLHLRTDISGSLKSKKNIKQLIEALHPTPAVCGLPKEKAKKFILSEENYDREFYTGFLGELNFQNIKERSRNRRNVENRAYKTVERQTSLFVNLRCMKIEGNKAFLYIGGGITKDSVPEDEWEETVNKAQTMKKVL